jgi:hypothetical protein
MDKTIHPGSRISKLPKFLQPAALLLRSLCSRRGGGTEGPFGGRFVFTYSPGTATRSTSL